MPREFDKKNLTDKEQKGLKSRFKLNLTFEEKIRQDFQRIALELWPSLVEKSFFKQNGLDYWQSIFSYLGRSGMLDTRSINRRTSRAKDLPKSDFYYVLNSRPIPDLSSASKPNIKPLIMHAAGASLNSDERISKAVGELVERYVLLDSPEQKKLSASPEELSKNGNSFVALERFNQFQQFQKGRFKYLNRNSDSKLYWVSSENLLSKEIYLIPSQCVFWNYKFNREEPRIFPPTTNGAAGFFDEEKAILAGIYELIERDGFLIYWLNKLSPKVIDTSDYNNKEFQDFKKYMESFNFEITFLNTATDVGIPSCACIIVNRRTNKPSISMSASAGLDAGKNLMTSLLGAYKNSFMWEYGKKKTILPPNYEPFLDPSIGMDFRRYLWHGEEMYQKFKFFISGEKINIRDIMIPKKWNSDAEELNYVLSIFKEMGAGYEVYCYKAQDKILDDLGYKVVKMVIPEIFPLYLRENLATLDSKRLCKVPEKLGLKPATPNNYNPYPHPFP